MRVETEGESGVVVPVTVVVTPEVEVAEGVMVVVMVVILGTARSGEGGGGGGKDEVFMVNGRLEGEQFKVKVGRLLRNKAGTHADTLAGGRGRGKEKKNEHAQ